MVSIKKAFTLIELIFAIIIMSIVVMSLPVMMKMTSDSIEKNIVQEAIFAASAELMGATTFYWDLNSMEDFSVSNYARVIDDGNCENNSSSLTNRLKVGHVAQPLHRRCLDSNTTMAIDTNSSIFPNLDNASKNNTRVNEVIFENPNPESKGYKKSYLVTVAIAKNDINGTINNNIKELTATIRNPDNNEVLTVLRTYCANIGEVDYYKRRF